MSLTEAEQLQREEAALKRARNAERKAWRNAILTFFGIAILQALAGADFTHSDMEEFGNLVFTGGISVGVFFWTRSVLG